MGTPKKTTQDVCAELERRLQEAEQKAAYYQKLAQHAGIQRLRETETLSHLLTEGVRMREELARNEARLRQIIDLLPYKIFVKNHEGRFLLVNTAAANSLNMTVEALTGQLHAEVHPDPAEVAQMLADDRRVIEDGQVLMIPEEPYTEADGEQRWLQTIKVPYVTADTAEPAVLGVAIDITENKRIQESLRASEQRFRELFEHSPDAILVEDVQGHVLDANPAACELHGMAREELLRKHAFELMPPDRRDMVAQKFPLLTTAESWQVEGVSWTKDGRAVPVDISISNIYYDGQPGLLVHLRDSSKRKQAEAELDRYRLHLEALVHERTLKLEQEITERKRFEEQLNISLREKEVLLKEVYHRVKNNLQVITSLLNLQATMLPDGPTRALFMESQTRVRSMSLIHEKLYQSDDLSRIHFTDYVRTLVHELLTLYKRPSSQIVMQFELSDAYFPLDTAIPCGLILNELVSNVLKYAFPNGKGTLDIRLEQGADGWYTLSIADNGIGLAPDLKIEQLHSLGLQLVKGLVEEQLNGTLELDRRAGTAWRIRFRA